MLTLIPYEYTITYIAVVLQYCNSKNMDIVDAGFHSYITNSMLKPYGQATWL